MVVPPIQSISGNNDGKYTSYMSPFMAGMLGLPRGSTVQVPASFFGIEKNKWAEVPRHSLL
jgi:hypothetical protein